MGRPPFPRPGGPVHPPTTRRTMRALLLTVGSQGDVQPFVALASRLRSGGHEAVLAAPALYRGLAAACDVPFVPLDLDLDRLGVTLAGQHGLRHLLTFCRSL